MTYDARGNGDGKTISTITGDHENRVTDYTSVICMAHGQANAEILENRSPTLNCSHEQPILVDTDYLARRLTPRECARLQGFPSDWGDIASTQMLTDDEYNFWLSVRGTHAIVQGKESKTYTKQQMLKWYSNLHSETAEYKMWGNGITLPNALYFMQGIAEDACKKES